MKHPIAKRSNQVMRYFTPELYVEFNSPEDEMADRANEAWEQANRDYRKHLEAIRHQLPTQVQILADLCLHDAEVLGYDENFQSILPASESSGHGPLWTAAGILCLRQGQTLRVLFYMLWDHATEHPPIPNWQFSKTRRHWLYDEIDIVKNHRDMFVHRILLSDGTVLEIPFTSAIVTTIPLPAEEKASCSKRIA